MYKLQRYIKLGKHSLDVAYKALTEKRQLCHPAWIIIVLFRATGNSMCTVQLSPFKATINGSDLRLCFIPAESALKTERRMRAYKYTTLQITAGPGSLANTVGDTSLVADNRVSDCQLLCTLTPFSEHFFFFFAWLTGVFILGCSSFPVLPVSSSFSKSDCVFVVLTYILVEFGYWSSVVSKIFSLPPSISF